MRISVALCRPPPVTSQRFGRRRQMLACARHGPRGKRRERRRAVLESQALDRGQREVQPVERLGRRLIEVRVREHAGEPGLVDPPRRRDPATFIIGPIGARAHPVVDQAVARPGVERDQLASPIQVTLPTPPRLSIATGFSSAAASA